MAGALGDEKAVWALTDTRSGRTLVRKNPVEAQQKAVRLHCLHGGIEQQQQPYTQQAVLLLDGAYCQSCPQCQKIQARGLKAALAGPLDHPAGWHA